MKILYYIGLRLTLPMPRLRRVFQDLDHVKALEPLDGRDGPGLAHLWQDIYQVDSIYLPRKDLVMRAAVHLHPALCPNRLNVLSNEDMAGFQPLSIDRGVLADRLKAITPKGCTPEVLILIRRQGAMVLDDYRLSPSLQTPEALSNHLEYLWQLKTRAPSFAHLNFNQLVSAYEALFGHEQITVLPVEMAAADPAEFHGRLADVLGCAPEAVAQALAWQDEPPAAPVATEPPLLQRLSPFAKEEPPAAALDLPRIWKKCICDHFRDSNYRLAERYDLPLDELGYFRPGP